MSKLSYLLSPSSRHGHALDRAVDGWSIVPDENPDDMIEL
jgi:hypothetical protein